MSAGAPEGKSGPTLPFIVSLDTTKGMRDVLRRSIPVDTLRESLRNATSALAEAFKDIQAVGQFRLDEITIGLEVTAEGGVEFIGSLTVGSKAAITLKFVPPGSR
jgi:hypothetical protein